MARTRRSPGATHQTVSPLSHPPQITDSAKYPLTRLVSALTALTHRALGAADAAADFKNLYSAGIAFAPKTESNAYKFASKRYKEGDPMRPDADDDGVAIFWKLKNLEATGVEFLGLDEPRANHGVLRVGLRRKLDRREFYVISTHLSSGAEAAKETRRLVEIREYTINRVGDKKGPSLLDWFKDSAQENPAVFCLDANSEPTRTEDDTVWKVMHTVRAAQTRDAHALMPSCTADHVDADAGLLIRLSVFFFACTVRRMRTTSGRPTACGMITSMSTVQHCTM